ncbi:MAG: hypothetical protein IJ172_07555 [Ruminococcus sp.]|nr:hypothetical protein [Ruminococcus sp.]
MKRIIVTRQKKFASSLMPYWVIPGSKQAFMAQFGLYGDIVQYGALGQPIQRIDIAVLDANGARIKNGEQIVLDLNDNVYTVFASTQSGSLSNEVYLQGGQFIDGIETYFLNMTTKGGMKTVSYPWFE